MGSIFLHMSLAPERQRFFASYHFGIVCIAIKNFCYIHIVISSHYIFYFVLAIVMLSSDTKLLLRPWSKGYRFPKELQLVSQTFCHYHITMLH